MRKEQTQKVKSRQIITDNNPQQGGYSCSQRRSLGFTCTIQVFSRLLLGYLPPLYTTFPGKVTLSAAQER